MSLRAGWATSGEQGLDKGVVEAFEQVDAIVGRHLFDEFREAFQVDAP